VNHAGATPAKSRRYMKLLLFVLVVVILNLGGTWLAHQINFQLFPRHEPILHLAVLLTAALYILLMTIPFMPGIEVGLALMLMLGSKGALLVYLCTLLALSISFLVGRTLPPRLVVQFLNWLHLYRAGALVHQLELLDSQERLDFLNTKIPSSITPFLLRHRYLAIAIMLNLPGNALIGGGGGISLMVGMSRIIPYPAFILLLALAVMPVPLLIFMQ